MAAGKSRKKSSRPRCGNSVCRHLSIMPPLWALGFARDSVRKDFDEQTPRCAFVKRRLSLPMEGLRRNVDEAPARQCACLCRAFLHDIGALLASDLLPVGVGCGVDP